MLRTGRMVTRFTKTTAPISIRFSFIIVLISLLLSQFAFIATNLNPTERSWEPEDVYVDPKQESRGDEITRGLKSRMEFDVKLNELMIFPMEGEGPWVEIYNSGNDYLPLDNWLISNEDGLTYQITNVKTVPPYSYIVVHFDKGESETRFGQSQPNALHLYTGWKNVRWTRHVVDSNHFMARAAVGYDIIPDGDPEILAHRFGGDAVNRINIYEPKADMTQEWTKTLIDEAGGSYRIKPIDIDADGIIDIVYNNYFGNENGGDSIHFIKGPGTGPKDPWGGPYAIGKVRRVEGLDAGNISGDNMMDVVVGCEWLDDIYWFKCPGDPTAEAWTKYNIDLNFNKPGGMKLFDMDMDLDLDLIAVGSYGEEVVWYEHPGDPTADPWTKHTIADKTRSRGNIDDDTSRRSSSRTQFDPIGELHLVDLDFDARMDVVVSESNNNRLVWYQSPPDPTDPVQKWFQHILDENISGPSGIDSGDFDGDGDTDIVATATSGAINWYAHPSISQIHDSDWECYTVDDLVHLTFYVNATDFDDDGDLDLVTADQSDGKIIWYENEYLEFTTLDQCGLYREPNTGPETIIDFVAWGGPAGAEDNNAVDIGIWQANTFVPLPSTYINRTYARDKYSSDTNMIDDWNGQNGVHSDIPTEGTKNYPLPTNELLSLKYNPERFTGAPNGSAMLPPQSMPKGLCLANYSSYTFRINVSNPFGWMNLEWIELILAPDGVGIDLLWTQLDNNFSVIDPNGYITLLTDHCSANTDGIYNWQINFTVVFNWLYPTETLQDVAAASKNRKEYFDNDIYNTFYRVVTTLNLTGDLVVRSFDTEKIMPNNDWVIPDFGLTISGLVVIYDVPNARYYPSDSQFNVLLEDSTGNTWLDYTSAGYETNFTLRVPEKISTGPYTLSVSLTNLQPGAADRRTVSQQLYIDAGQVKYDHQTPEETVWHTHSPVICSVRITDPQPESGVLGSSIAYRVANVTEERFGEWIPKPINGTGEVLEPVISYRFNEGPNNWLQWRSSDLVGNGPTNSMLFRVPVDTRTPTYHAFYPPESLIQPDTNVIVRITLADFSGSGINTSTIRAAVKPAGETEYSDWLDAELTIEAQSDPTTKALPAGPETVTISAVITAFNNGTDNYIRFRALDMAGNGFAESNEFKIQVNIQQKHVAVSLVEPLNDSIVRTVYPVLKWQPQLPVAFDKLSYYVYLSTHQADLTQIIEHGVKTKNVIQAVVPGTDLELDFDEAGLAALIPDTYYWTVIPVLDLGHENITYGSCSDGIWKFRIYLSKTGLELSAEPEAIQIYSGDNSSFKIKIRNIGQTGDTFNVIFMPDGGLVVKLSRNNVFLGPTNFTYLDLSVLVPTDHESGEFKIIIKAQDQNSTVDESLELKVNAIQKPPDKPDTTESTKGYISSMGSVMVIILLMLFLILLTAAHHLYIHRRSRRAERESDKPVESKTVTVELQSRPVVELPSQIPPEAPPIPEKTPAAAVARQVPTPALPAPVQEPPTAEAQPLTAQPAPAAQEAEPPSAQAQQTPTEGPAAEPLEKPLNPPIEN